jgi:hypothetical protein
MTGDEAQKFWRLASHIRRGYADKVTLRMIQKRINETDSETLKSRYRELENEHSDSPPLRDSLG